MSCRKLAAAVAFSRCGAPGGSGRVCAGPSWWHFGSPPSICERGEKSRRVARSQGRISWKIFSSWSISGLLVVEKCYFPRLVGEHRAYCVFPIEVKRVQIQKHTWKEVERGWGRGDPKFINLTVVLCVFFFLLDGPSDEQLKITSVLKQNHVT